MYSILLFWNYTVILRIFNQIENKVQTIYQFEDLYSRKDMKLVFSRFFRPSRKKSREKESSITSREKKRENTSFISFLLYKSLNW
jgi:hypothetical protein